MMLDLETLKEAVAELDEDKVMTLLREFAAANPTQEEAQQVLEACQSGMTAVGDLFEKNVYFVGDLVFAAELMTGAMEILKPVLGAGRTGQAGTILLGTVAGDLHDIGKNIFKNMAEAAGFSVYDLGIDQPATAFVEKAKELRPDIVGMSGLLTLALESMKETVEALKAAGLREKVKVIIGGNPVTAEACKHIGADAFTVNAAEGIKICLKWVGK